MLLEKEFFQLFNFIISDRDHTVSMVYKNVGHLKFQELLDGIEKNYRVNHARDQIITFVKQRGCFKLSFIMILLISIYPFCNSMFLYCYHLSLMQKPRIVYLWGKTKFQVKCSSKIWSTDKNHCNLELWKGL